MVVCTNCRRDENTVAFICNQGHTCCNNCFNHAQSDLATKKAVLKCHDCCTAFDSVGVQVIQQQTKQIKVQTPPISTPITPPNKTRYQAIVVIVLISFLVMQLAVIFACITNINERISTLEFNVTEISNTTSTIQERLITAMTSLVK